jgi:hypothetical protein
MRVQVPDAGVGAAALEHRVHAVCRQGRPAPATQPEPWRVCIWMPPPLAEVAIQRSGGLDSEWDRSVAGAAAPARLARYVQDSVAQVDVGDLEAGELRQPEPTVQEQHDDRRVPARGEVGPDAGGEQGAQGLVRQHRSFRSPGAGVLIPAVASRPVSPSLSIQRRKWCTPANHPRAVLLEWRSRTSTSQPRMCWRFRSAGPTSGWCSASQLARLRTAFWYALTVCCRRGRRPAGPAPTRR